MTLLELCAVSRVYRQGGAWGRGKTVRAVDNASLAIEAGKCLAVVGASGSGKSTLGRLILGLERPDEGRVLFRGEDFWTFRGAAAREARRAIQVVFQNSQGAVNPRFSACRIVGEPLVNFDGLSGKVLRDRVGDLLEQVGIEAGAMDKKPHQFSGGELQRVCLARALASRPELLVLDEAVSSLDMLNQSRVITLLENVKEKTGCASVFISHDLRVVSRFADAIAVMEGGRLAGVVDDVDGSADADVSALGVLAEAVLPAEPSSSGHLSGRDHFWKTSDSSRRNSSSERMNAEILRV